jgi:hypothetical protein
VSPGMIRKGFLRQRVSADGYESEAISQG